MALDNLVEKGLGDAGTSLRPQFDRNRIAAADQRLDRG
jgi:hypothetical protein